MLSSDTASLGGKLVKAVMEKQKLLRADFPPQAYQEYKPKGSGGPQFTTLKAQYVVERLSDVFGPHGIGWNHSWTDFVEMNNGEVAVCVCIHAAWDEGIQTTHSAIGSAKISLMGGDAYKAAITDGMTKAASYMGVGHDMFLGLINADGSKKGEKKPKKQTKPKPAPKPTIPEGTEVVGAPEDLLNDGQRSFILACLQKLPQERSEGFFGWIKAAFQADEVSELTQEQASACIGFLQKGVKK